MRKLLMILFLGMALYSLIGCKSSPNKPTIEILDWKKNSIDSVELLYYPNYLEQKEYSNQFIADSSLSKQLEDAIHSDTVQLNFDAYQFKIYLFAKGEPFKTLYVSTKDGEEFLSYVVNGVRFYHPLNEQLKLALQEFTGV